MVPKVGDFVEWQNPAAKGNIWLILELYPNSVKSCKLVQSKYDPGCIGQIGGGWSFDEMKIFPEHEVKRFKL